MGILGRARNLSKQMTDSMESIFEETQQRIMTAPETLETIATTIKAEYWKLAGKATEMSYEAVEGVLNKMGLSEDIHRTRNMDGSHSGPGIKGPGM